MKNLFTIFVSPEETFKRVRDKSKTAWLIPFILLIAISLVSIFLQMPVIEQTAKESLQVNGLADSATVDTVVAGAIIGAIVMAPLSIAAVTFIGALLYILLNLIVRGEAKYMQLVTMISYAALPGTLGGLITSIIIFATGAQSATEVSLSLAALVSDKSSMLYHLLLLVNPFSLWGLALYVVGAAVMMKRPRKTVGMWIIGTWLVFSLGSLLLV
ncbi:Yip1-like protein [Fontibacillus phaseoli]|uniref:Yip1-like protein n=1 Tax=Fontibacillus phaseoli TaxID=1416533 RepID=A0A369B6G3_9BACL|nr:YIP1 family protein [Fontibacillus phaseoli]RCX16198.1 Yip1-like protein [Fontibacillus phaseoli]